MSIDEVAVVVLSYGTGGEYAPLVDSLLAEGVAPADLLVVHNPSRPGEASPVVPPGCEVLAADRNLGYAGGMNLGIERVLGDAPELVVLLTHDARPRPGALEQLVEAARRMPAYGVLGPALLLAGTDEPFSFGGITRGNGTVAHIEAADGASDGVIDCDWVDGGTMVLRGEALRRVGGLEERFWGYCEESELCLRIARAGYRIGVVVAAKAEQDPGGMKRPGAWAYLLTRNGIEFARRAAGPRGVLAVTRQAVGTLAVSAARVVVRALRLRPGDPAEPWQLLAGTACGLLDAVRRRWGPPPPWLPGLGDLRNVQGP